jgi:hypothetical protein
MAVARQKQITPEEARIQQLKKEPRVKVYGNEIFQDQLGETYTFLYNGLPVTIKFDGSYQEYPESVAQLLESKLSEIAKANTRKNINTRIG